MKTEFTHQARRKDESFALLKMMCIAERDIRSGSTMSLPEAKEVLTYRRAQGKPAPKANL